MSLLNSSDVRFHRVNFIRSAGRAFPVEAAMTEDEAGALFDEALALPADQFMGKLLELVRNAEQASTDRVFAAVALVTHLAEARHFVGAA
jgi:hypothetical protein